MWSSSRRSPGFLETSVQIDWVVCAKFSWEGIERFDLQRQDLPPSYIYALIYKYYLNLVRGHIIDYPCHELSVLTDDLDVVDENNAKQAEYGKITLCKQVLWSKFQRKRDVKTDP